jgi:hypothetical protein
MSPGFLVLFAQFVLAALACLGLYRLWRRVSLANRAVYWLVTIGVLVRAIGAQVAFWLSFLYIPIGKSLQTGRGLWTFGSDAARFYFPIASAAAFDGPLAILTLSKTVSSVFYVQAFAAALFLFGFVTSVAILINLAAYLGCCAMALWLANGKNQRMAVFAIGAMSLSPSFIFWSFQPLKDVLFLFLVAMFFAAARFWQDAWRSDEPSRRIRSAALATAAMTAALYGVAGTRWYFALLLLCAVVPFTLISIIRAHHRLASSVAAAAMLLILGWAFFAGAGPYVPADLREAALGSGLRGRAKIPGMILANIRASRKSFDHAGGATLIGAGGAIRTIDTSLNEKEARVVRSVFGHVDLPPATTSTTIAHPHPAAQPPAPESRAVKPAAASPPPVVKKAKPASAPVPVQPPTDRVASQSAPPAKAPAPARVPSATPVVSPAPPATANTGPDAKKPDLTGDPKIDTVAMPVSPLARFAAGLVAVLLPRAVAQRFGILDMAGGRGLWLFAELDTVAFDIVLIGAVLAIVHGLRRRSLKEPVFWMMLIVTTLITVALAYTVSNFGTLLRHRDMILLGLVLLPLAIPASSPETSAPAIPQAPASASPARRFTSSSV